MNKFATVSIVCGLAVMASVPAAARTFFVRPGESVEEAVAAACRHGAATNEVVLGVGKHHLSRTITLTAADSGLVIRAVKPGKAVVYGGVAVTNWVKESSSPFWYASLPGVKEGEWDFRVLLVDDRAAPRACFPGGTNRLHVVGGWDLPLASGIMGVWPREPRYDEMVTLRYDPKEVPAALDFRNAEILHYHIWRASYSSVASNDAALCTLYFSNPGDWPVGACKRKDYEIYNVREGMKEPGQWYLDRTAGRVVYWPRPGEDVLKAHIVAPKVECAIRMSGTPNRPVRDITIDGLAIRAVSAPPRSITRTTAAVELHHASGVRIADVDVSDVAGWGIRVMKGKDNKIEGCTVRDAGADGIMVMSDGCSVISNKVFDTGRIFPAATGLYLFGKGLTIRGNFVHNTPYCGIKVSGSGFTMEDNEVHHAMQILRDGAAFYATSLKNSAVRGNIVHDMPFGSGGFGTIAFYADERSRNVVYEDNVAWNVDFPLLCHLADDITVKRNVFMSPAKMRLAFSASRGCRVEDNTFMAQREFTVSTPEAVSAWTGNRVYQQSSPGGPMALDRGYRPVPTRQPAARVVTAPRAAAAPTPDGTFAPNEWPTKLFHVRMNSERYMVSGMPTSLRVSWDDDSLHFAVFMGSWETEYTRGTTWGVDDAVELNVNGKVVRAYANGTVESADAAFRDSLKIFAGPQPGRTIKDWSYPFVMEAIVPFRATGLKPEKGMVIPFNVAVHSSRTGQTAFYEVPAPDNGPSSPPGKIKLDE